MKERLWVKWLTRDLDAIEQVRRRFNMPHYTTLNGFTPCEIDSADMELLKETARRGFLSIFNATWCKNGGTFSFISRKK